MGRFLLLSLMGILAAGVPAAAPASNSPSSPSVGVEAPAIARLPLPGEGRGDFITADHDAGRLFVTHGRVVHILDLKSLKPLASVTGLTAAHGVALDRAGHGFVTDGNSDSVLEFDPSSGRVLKRITVGKHPDAILFDPASSRIMAFNVDSESVSVIDPASASVVGSINLPSAPEYPQADGRGHVYVTLEEANAIGVIDSARMAFDHLIPLAGCDGPTPLALDRSNRRLLAGCGNRIMVVVAADSGKILASLPIGEDPDGIVYDPGTRHVVVANRDGTWTIIRQASADSYQVDRILRIDEYAKTLALDPVTHRLFSSTADLVWPPSAPGGKHLPDARPGTFRLIIVSQR